MGSSAFVEFRGCYGHGIRHPFIQAEPVAQQDQHGVHGGSHVADGLAHEIVQFRFVECRTGVGCVHRIPPAYIVLRSTRVARNLPLL